jgi:hypothetical protein
MSEFRDVYRRITDKIITDLEQGVRPWHRPWNADHAAGRITCPLRPNRALSRCDAASAKALSHSPRIRHFRWISRPRRGLQTIDFP